MRSRLRGGSSLAPRGGEGVDPQRGWGVVNGGWGVGWTVKWKLNRKKRKSWIPIGGCDPPNPPPPPLDPPLLV